MEEFEIKKTEKTLEIHKEIYDRNSSQEIQRANCLKCKTNNKTILGGNQPQGHIESVEWGKQHYRILGPYSEVPIRVLERSKRWCGGAQQSAPHFTRNALPQLSAPSASLPVCIWDGSHQIKTPCLVQTSTDSHPAQTDPPFRAFPHLFRNVYIEPGSFAMGMKALIDEGLE